MLLKGKVAVVTGAGRGIGEAIVKKLSDFGASVVVTDVNKENAIKVADDLKGQGRDATAFYFDVSDFNSMGRKIFEIKEIYHKIDIWVNNAGITEAEKIENITEEQWDRMQDIDLKSVFFCTQSVFKIMKEQNYGKLIHISSMAGERAGRSSSASYSAAKAGVINIAKSFALQGGKYNITSNAICPGRIVTELTKDLSWMHDDPTDYIPLQRFGNPEDVAGGVVFYASDLSRYVTGDTMRLNGGMYF